MAYFDKSREQLERRSATGRWQVVKVRFDVADADTIVTHQVPTPAPEQLNYQAVRASGPAVVYHDGSPSRRPWGEGFIILRCNVAPVEVDVLISVAADNVNQRPLPLGTFTTPSVNADTLDGFDSSAFAKDAWARITVSGQSDVVADSTADSFELEAGSGVSITTNAGTDKVTISSTVVSGANKAPDSEAYVTIGNTSNLSAERALTGSAAVKITDGGANSTVTIDLNRAFARKTADETVTSSTALQDDDHLTASIGASEVWEYRFHLVYDAVAAGDFQFAFNVPASATGLFSFLGPDATTATNLATGASSDLTDTGTKTVGGAGAGVLAAVFVSLLVVNSTNAGTVKLRWAQGTSSGTGTILKTGSYLLGNRVA